MRIAGAGFSVPSKVVTNQDLVNLVEKHSADVFDGRLDRCLQAITLFLNHMGARERRWLEDGETTFDIALRAINEALNKAQMTLADIDLLVYASVDRRVLEPATANLLAKALGIPHTPCFDVVEACSSWVRATQISQAFLDTGIHKNILVVSMEFPHHGLPQPVEKFRLRNMAELDWAFPIFTVGEGASATVLTTGGEPWRYRNRTRSDMADLCMFPLCGTDAQTSSLNGVSLAGPALQRFASYGRDIQAASLGDILTLMREHPVRPWDVDLFIPHTQNVSWWHTLEKKLGYEKGSIPYYFLMPLYGNLVNNSFPGGIVLAEQEGRLTRGDRVAALMTAAGMSLTLMDFVY